MGNLSLCLFINYAFIYTWIRQNLNETVPQLDFHDFHWENKTHKLQRSIRQKTEPFSCATVDTVHNINRRSSRNNQTYNFQFFLLDQEHQGEVSCNIIMYALKITILDLLGCYENPVRFSYMYIANKNTSASDPHILFIR